MTMQAALNLNTNQAQEFMPVEALRLVINQSAKDSWTIGEFAAVMGVSDRYIRSMIDSDTLPTGYGVRVISKRNRLIIRTPSEKANITENKPLTETPSETALEKGKPVSLPTQGEEIARKKYDLVLEWRSYRSQQGKDKAYWDDEFDVMYNVTRFYVALYDALGKVSIKTLLRWDKTLREHDDDWHSLIPGYKYETVENMRKISISTADNRELSITIPKTQLKEKDINEFLKLWMIPNRPMVSKVVQIINFNLLKKGMMPKASLSTYERFAQNFTKYNNDVVTFLREGRKAYSEQVNFSIIRDLDSIYVGQIFVADGHELKFSIVNPWTGKSVRATIVAFVDMASCAIAGFEIMLTEDTTAVLSAFRNAVLGSGIVPEIAYTDNGKAFRNKLFKGDNKTNFEELGWRGMYSEVGTELHFARPYNARAKQAVENGWYHMAETLEVMMPTFMGRNPEDKPAYTQRNEKFHKALHEKIVEEITIQEAVKAVNDYRALQLTQPHPRYKGKTIGEVYREGIEEFKKRFPERIADENILSKMMMSAPKPVRLYANGVKFLGEYYYNNALHGLKEYVNLRYDYSDYRYVMVECSRGLIKCEISLKHHPFVGKYGTPENIHDYKAVKKLQAKNEKDTAIKAAVLHEQLGEAISRINTEEIEEAEIKEIEAAEIYKNYYLTD